MSDEPDATQTKPPKRRRSRSEHVILQSNDHQSPVPNEQRLERKKSMKARRRSRSELNIALADDLLDNAAYKKDDIVLTKDTGSTMCVIKTVRSANIETVQYGIVIPPESNIRYIKPAKIVKKLQPESVIARIESVTKAYEDANGEMLKLQAQLKMARKQSEIEKDKFKKLKQRFADQNTVTNETSKTIDKLQRDNDKLRRDLEQKQNDFVKFKKDRTEDNIWQKQLSEANKQVKSLNKSLSQQRITINKQKTDLSQQKAKHNRIKLNDMSDSKQIIKLQKESMSKDRTISDLKQQMITLQNKLSAANTDLDRTQKRNKRKMDINMEQIGLQRKKLDSKLKSLKNKESELQSLQISKRRHKQQLNDIAKQKQELLKQQKLLDMSSKQLKQKRGTNKRSDRAKVIVHKKYLCKEYMDCCVKWRKRKDAIFKCNTQLKVMHDSLKPTLKRLAKLDDNKRISKGKNKLEKPNKNDLKEYLDVALPLEDVEEQLGELLLDAHPQGKHIKSLPLQLLAKQDEIDRLQNELQKYKINSKLSDHGIRMDQDPHDDEDDELEDVHGPVITKNGNASGANNPYKQQFAGMYRMVAKDLDENTEDILSELKCVITKIGDDIETTYQRNDESNGFTPKTEELCMEYEALQQTLHTQGGSQRRRRRDSDDSENMYTGTERIFMQRHGESLSDDEEDSSSVMSDEWRDSNTQHHKGNMSNGAVTLGLNPKDLVQTAEKVDYLTDNARQHLNELKAEQTECKQRKQKISATKRDLMQCQGLLEIIEEKESVNNEDMTQSKENLQTYNEEMESAQLALEHRVSALHKDEERTSKLMHELQDLKHKISDEKLKTLQDQLVSAQSSTSMIPTPNVLELEDLRRKIESLHEKALDDADWLEDSIKSIEEYKKTCVSLQDSVEEISPSIHKFARRPQKKLLEHLLEYNWDLGEVADRLKDKQQSLNKFSDEEQDIRMDCVSQLGNEWTQQDTVLSEYKKRIRRLEERHQGIMFDAATHKVTEQGAVYELEAIMNEICDLLENTRHKINDNHLNLNTQRLASFLCLEQVNNTRDLVIDTVQIPIPSTPNIDDDEEEDMEVMEYKYAHALAGCSKYDDTVTLHKALNRIRCILASISPLHYAVVSDEYLKPKAIVVKNELSKLLKNYEHFSPIQTDISIDDEVSNYEVQLIQDLAADYHEKNALEEKRFVIKENMKTICASLNDLDALCDDDVTCIELKHLKQMYLSFMKTDLPQPLPLYDDDPPQQQEKKKRRKRTQKADYKRSMAQKYVGLDENADEEDLRATIEQIEAQLFSLRAHAMPFAFNLIYCDGILFGNAFAGDFRKLKKYNKHRAAKKKKKYRESDEWALSVDDYNEMSQEDRVELIKELMHLEWQYAEWMYDREDYVTQKMLYHQQSLYYKRLFVMPLNDFYLEMERENIFAAAEYERDELKAPKKDRNFVEERKMMEVKLEKLSSSSSEVDYLSVDSEQAEQKRGMRINEQNTANVSNLDLFSHRGLVEKNHHNLEMDDLLRDDIHMSPNPNPRWFEENETIHEYIGKQIESELKHLKMTAELEQMAQEEEEEKEWMHDEGSSSCSSTQMEDEDGEEEDEEYILDRFREILTNHQFMPQVDDDGDGDEDEVDLMLDQIETLCRDVDKYHNKYMNHWQKSKALRNQLEIAENTLDDLVNEHDRLKQEYLKLRHENQTLSDKLKLQETPQGGGNTTAGGPNDDGMEERDILYQLKDDLLHLRQDINDSQQSAKSEYKQSKIRLESMCEPLSDLANDFDSQVLKDALTKLSKSLNDIHNLKKQRLYQHGPLANIVESNIDDIDDLLNSMQQQQMNNKATTTKGGGELEDEAVSGNVDEMDKLYPELIYFDDDDDDDNEHKDEFVAADTAGQQENIEFDANFPVVRRIEIGGNWFNKKARAVIEWNGSTFTRKMADFKWLWRMLLLNSSVDRVVPDYPNDIPESLWPQGYLRRRKRELNLFLMQCHSLPWIKNYNLYYDIFLEQEKHEWKRKRDEFDEEIMQKIKKKEATYIQHTIDKNNNANNSDNNDNDTNHHNNNNNQYHQ